MEIMLLNAIRTKKHVALVLCLLVACCALTAELSLAQRDSDEDFEDSGFDDSGYNSPSGHEAEGSNQNPSNYSPNEEEDLDEDDDTDETNMNTRRAEPEQRASRMTMPLQQQQRQLQLQQALYANQMGNPQRFYDPANSVMLANVAPVAYNRYRRSTVQEAASGKDVIEDKQQSQENTGKETLVRRRRHSKYIGPVYTYVKTDKYARVKWGVKHKVGKHYG